MKKFISLVCCLFLANSFYPQIIETHKELESETVVAINQSNDLEALSNLNTSNKATVKTVGLNATYINSSVFTENAAYVKNLQQRASKYDVKKSDAYNHGKSSSTYNVGFSTKKGDMTVTYNSDGQINSSKERYKNVALPKPVIVSIMKAYPSWHLDSNICNINYKHNKGVLTSYKVKISKGNQTKTVKSDDKGNII